MALETELKSIVDDFEARQARVREAGGRPVFAGRLLDWRYDRRKRRLLARDHVLRLRVQIDAERTQTWLEWKGPTRYAAGYKLREEVSTEVADRTAMASMLDRLGYIITREIEREVYTYELHGAIIRFERYPRMDDLVEVEGSPDAIEKAISAIGIPRLLFSSEGLPEFTRRYEDRTGERAALCARELAGDYRFDLDDA
jgi:predicted adenylyl cyclase CyaB